MIVILMFDHWENNIKTKLGAKTSIKIEKMTCGGVMKLKKWPPNSGIIAHSSLWRRLFDPVVLVVMYCYCVRIMHIVMWIIAKYQGRVCIGLIVISPKLLTCWSLYENSVVQGDTQAYMTSGDYTGWRWAKSFFFLKSSRSCHVTIAA